MKHGPIIAALAAVVPITACDALGIDDTRIRIYEVAPHKGNCQGLFETLCLRVRVPGEEAFQNFLETPRGFDFEWGFAYLIRVEERELDEVPADGSSIRRTLDRLLSRTRVPPGTVFTVTIPSGFLATSAPGRYDLPSESLELQCLEPADCTELDSLVAEESRVHLALAFPESPDSPLLIQSWQARPHQGSSEAIEPLTIQAPAPR